jgi:lipopolysaccharide transport system ATP-binding protein
MSEVAIRVEGLGKRYRIGTGGARPRYRSLRESLAQSAKSAWSSSRSLFRKGGSTNRESGTFWALRDISFDVRRGEVVGVIGRNGAGKSTLLKTLSRITEPTEGYAEIHGRVGSLLEVGSGFHPELTGRENIYLNGAILGMKKEEIRRKFDEIVAFAEMEKFLDTPVKRYSSGMYMRLAFSVAAHLDPEILVVDEVLAVGDSAFQKKCLGKMGEAAHQNRTILFVSHNMPAVLNLCSRVIVLEGGRIVADETAPNAVERYLAAVESATSLSLSQRTDRQGNGTLLFSSFQLANIAGEPISLARSGEDLQLMLSYRSSSVRALRDVHVAIGVHGQFDQDLFHLATSIVGNDFEQLPPEGEICCLIPRLPLQPGRYTLNLYCTVRGEIADWIQGCGAFHVEGRRLFRDRAVTHSWQGAVSGWAFLEG